MIKVDTKRRILDSAERLFAEHGVDATSLRSIIEDARVNLAAIHYHYHSKQDLLDAVLMRRLEPVNQLRLEMLDSCGEKPTLEAGQLCCRGFSSGSGACLDCDFFYYWLWFRRRPRCCSLV